MQKRIGEGIGKVLRVSWLGTGSTSELKSCSAEEPLHPVSGFFSSPYP